MFKKILFSFAVIASILGADMTAANTEMPGNACTTVAYDRNSDGYIYKGTITLTRVVSGNRETFYLFNKGGVDYVAKSKSGPFYRLARRMNINGVDYKY